MPSEEQELSEPARLLLLVSLLAKDRLISHNGKAFLKELILRRDPPLLRIFAGFGSNPSFLEHVHQLIDRESRETFEAMFSDFSLSAGKALSKAERRRKNLTDDTSLIYGEVEFSGFANILREVSALTESDPGGVFYDLGSGTGKAVFVARLTQDFRYCIGIEILQPLHDAAQRVTDDFNSFVRHRLDSAHPQHAAVYAGSFLHYDWSDGDVIFANSTCFPDDLMQALARQAERLKVGAVVITFTKGLPSPPFQLVYKKRFEMSWGPATVFVHRKLSPERGAHPAVPPVAARLSWRRGSVSGDGAERQARTGSRFERRAPIATAGATDESSFGGSGERLRSNSGSEEDDDEEEDDEDDDLDEEDDDDEDEEDDDDEDEEEEDDEDEEEGDDHDDDNDGKEGEDEKEEEGGHARQFLFDTRYLQGAASGCGDRAYPPLPEHLHDFGALLQQAEAAQEAATERLNASREALRRKQDELENERSAEIDHVFAVREASSASMQLGVEMVESDEYRLSDRDAQEDSQTSIGQDVGNSGSGGEVDDDDDDDGANSNIEEEAEPSSGRDDIEVSQAEMTARTTVSRMGSQACAGTSKSAAEAVAASENNLRVEGTDVAAAAPLAMIVTAGGNGKQGGGERDQVEADGFGVEEDKEQIHLEAKGGEQAVEVERAEGDESYGNGREESGGAGLGVNAASGTGESEEEDTQSEDFAQHDAIFVDEDERPRVIKSSPGQPHTRDPGSGDLQQLGKPKQNETEEGEPQQTESQRSGPKQRGRLQDSPHDRRLHTESEVRREAHSDGGTVGNTKHNHRQRQRRQKCPKSLSLSTKGKQGAITTTTAAVATATAAEATDHVARRSAAKGSPGDHSASAFAITNDGCDGGRIGGEQREDDTVGGSDDDHDNNDNVGRLPEDAVGPELSKNARQSREQSGDRNGGGRRSYYPEDGGDADGDGGRAGGECRGKDQRCDPGDILGMMTVGAACTLSTTGSAEITLPLLRSTPAKARGTGQIFQEAVPEHGPAFRPHSPPPPPGTVHAGTQLVPPTPPCMDSLVPPIPVYSGLEPLDSPQGTALLARKAERPLQPLRQMEDEGF